MASVVLVMPASGQAAVLYDQTTGTAAASSTESQNATDQPNRSSQAADDFTVPNGEAWTIQELDVSGTGVLGTVPVNVFVYADVGIPGGQLFGATDVSASGGPNFSIPISGAPALPPGTYWVSAQADLTFATNAWFWKNRAPQSGHPAAWRNPGNFHGDFCIDWTPRDACPSQADASFPDQAFRLIGTASHSNVITMGKTTLNKKKGTATLNLTLPNPGELTGSGNGVKAASAGRAVISKSVGAGAAQLLIKAKGKKKKTLNETGKVKLNVAITYTPTGGDPSTQSVKVKLKKKL